MAGVWAAAYKVVPPASARCTRLRCAPRSLRVDTLGSYRVTVHTFDDAFVVQFRESRTDSVALVFERELGTNLHSFLMECEAYRS